MTAVIYFLMRDMSIVKSTTNYATKYRFSTHDLIVRFIILIVNYQNQSIDILQVHHCLFIKFIKEREPIFHSFVPLQNDVEGKT